MILGLEGYICCLHLPPTSDVFVFLMGREVWFLSRVFIYSIACRMRATFQRKLKVLEDLESIRLHLRDKLSKSSMWWKGSSVVKFAEHHDGGRCLLPNKMECRIWQKSSKSCCLAFILSCSIHKLSSNVVHLNHAKRHVIDKTPAHSVMPGPVMFWNSSSQYLQLCPSQTHSIRFFPHC